MTNDEFSAWIQGFYQLENPDLCLTPKQLTIIENHLNLVDTIDGKLDDKNQALRDVLRQLKDESCRNEPMLQAATKHIGSLYSER